MFHLLLFALLPLAVSATVDCTPGTSSGVCNAISGCGWQSSGVCEPLCTVIPAYSDSDCAASLSCYFDNGKCFNGRPPGWSCAVNGAGSALTCLNAGACYWAAGAHECRDGNSPAPCNTAPYPSDRDGCNAINTVCHWDEGIPECLDGGGPIVSGSCEDLTDHAACNGNTACTYNLMNGACFTTPPACTTLTHPDCSQRSDCSWSSSCLAVASGCGTYTTGADCYAAGCLWDSFTSLAVGGGDSTGSGQCLFNLQEINLIYGCAHWSGYPRTVASTPACSFHGCAQGSGSTCLATDSGNSSVDNRYIVSTVIEHSIVDPHVLPSSLRFQAEVVLPLSIFWQPSSPVYHAVVIGRPAAVDLYRYLDPGHTSPCTSVADHLGTPNGPTSYTGDLSTLYAYFQTQVTATGSLEFSDTSDARHTAIRSIIGGGWNTADGQLVTEAAIQGTDLVLSIDGFLSTWVTQCNITHVAAPGYAAYQTPLTLIQRSVSGTAGTTNQFVSTGNLNGTISTSATSANALVSTQENLDVAQLDCPTGRSRQTYTIRLVFTNAFDATQVIGLRSVSDLTLLAQPANTLGNCFGLEVTSVVPPTSCPDFECTTLVDFRKRCTPEVQDGSTFNLCANQLASARITDMGSDIPYPSPLDFRADFWIKPRSWSQATGITDTHSTPAGQDPLGLAYDQVPVTIDVDYHPSQQLNITFDVRGGLLPTPQSPFSDRRELGYSNGTSYTDLRNTQLYFDRSLTPLIWLGDADARETFTLRMRLDSLRFYGLSSIGAQLGVAPLTWSQIQASTQRSPRTALAGCSTCQLLDAATALVGVDGFAIPVVLLRALLPANGYRMAIDYEIVLPSGSGSGSGSGRRLLQVVHGVAQNGTFEMAWLYDPDTGAIIDPSRGWDIGETTTSTGKAVGTVAGVLGGCALIGLALAFFVV